MAKRLSAELRAKLDRIVHNIASQAHDAALETELVGIGAMKERITAAETNWGRARQSGLVPGPGGRTGPRPHAGRRETDQMYDAVTGKTDWETPRRIEITWGWESRADFEKYYKFQEYGTKGTERRKGIEAMESLHYSLHAADDDLMARLRRIR